MNIRPWLATGACAAALALVATSGAAANATAVQHGTAPVTVHVKGLHRVSNVRLPRTALPRVSRVHNTLYSTNWSGYTAIAKKNVQIRFVSANFNVPSINCASTPVGTAGSAVSHWVGLDGLVSVPDGVSDTVEQAGVTGYCTSTTSAPAYYVWYEMYPAEPVTFEGVNPGDALNVSVYLNPSTNVYNLVVTDVTDGGAGFSADATCAPGPKCLNSSAEIISEVPSSTAGTVTLADFGMENYTGASVTARDGVRGNLSASNLWTSQPMVMLDGSGSVMAQPSSLEGGQAFSTQWVSGS